MVLARSTIRSGSPVSSSRSAPASPRARRSRRRPIRTHHAVPREAHGSGGELASRPDGPRSSAGFAGAVCSRGEASEGGRSPPPSVMRTRTLVVAAFIACAFAGLVARLAFVQIVKHDEYTRLADNQHAKTIPLKPKRGPILDRNGQAFAVSSRAESLYALTSRVEDRDALARRLAPILGDSAREIAKRLDSPKRFVFVKRRLPPDTVEAVRNLGEPALGFVDESMRLYPHRELAAHVVGIRGHGRQGPGGSRAGVGRAPRGRRGAGPRRAGCPRPRDHGRAQGDQAVHGGAGRDAHPRRHAAVHRGEGDRRGVAAHALEGGARARHGSAHGRDPGAGDSPDVQPEQLRRRHRRRAAQPRRHRPLRARLDVQGDPRGRRPRGGRGAPHRPLLCGERRHQGGERHDPRPQEVRLAHVLGGAPELLQRGFDQGRPLPRQGAVLQVHLRIRLRRPDGRGPDRGEPGTAPGAEAVVGTLARDHVDRPGDLGDRAPDGLGVLGRRQWRAPAAAADRPRHPRRRGPGNAARARAARRSPGHQPGDGPDAHRDHDRDGRATAPVTMPPFPATTSRARRAPRRSTIPRPAATRGRPACSRSWASCPPRIRG